MSRLEKQSPHSREYDKVDKDVMGQAQMCQIIMYLTLTRFACNYSSIFRNMGGTLLLWELKPLIFLHIDPCGNVLLSRQANSYKLFKKQLAAAAVGSRL
ncbi:hypothetical protein SLEP1_g23523 [Rubroshorea leprosula]|uniref:Uncharacterized protein n=1 Tax=Rubroshorea leprosula TaxID=152421 RepID=A0AAV5JCN2_9ROSI|nr:hypothetical protein SLEP1_g23523 [Rubroshorea leprosula]